MRPIIIAALMAISMAACAPTPTPTVTPSAQATLVTEQIQNLIVTHPQAWQMTSGPGPAEVGRLNLFPLFYLSNTPLGAVTCSPNDGCSEPTDALPAGGALVSVSRNPGLAEMLPPSVYVEAASGDCQSIGGERHVYAVVEGVVVNACLRGPGRDQAEAQVRELISALHRAP